MSDLAKTFPGHAGEEVQAVGGVSFRAHAGEVFGLLGLNGAGKTTTLRMLSTVLTPTRGTASLAGHDIREEPMKVRESIGFLSGTTGLYHRLTPRETLRFFGQFHGLEGAALDARVDLVLRTFGIEPFADQRCEKLSTGMKQKTNIGRTVVHDPAVLILDEPTSGLDVLAAQASLDFVEQCKQEGKCVVFSTHIMSEAERLCDRVAIIHEGTIRAEGTVEELRERTGRHYLEDIFRDVVLGEAKPSRG
ncbi:MAG: ATP-binding cassette domain-containing protein [Gemmatimonadetes bacterium]|nr:ATP-binding cassette domain-containing protein [Gemmatimonadota bacterium]